MSDWILRDLRHNWHPYTQMSRLVDAPPIVIERAEGVRLYASDGRWYYDTVASWWCNVHGHGHPRIREAIARQAASLDHVLFAGTTHRPAIELSERLAAIAPPGLERVFYSDNGSTAVEVALKMSLQYWRNVGRAGKTGFIALERGYHGDTVGCMSVSGVDLFNRLFEALTFESVRVPCPCCYRCPLGLAADSCEARCADFLEQALARCAGTTAAVIVEPLLMAAGGMIVYPEAWLAKAARLARGYGVHLIADEVATGFGRTGAMFACDRAGVSPDFLCLSKGLTSGTLPFAATLTTGDVYDAFLGAPESGRTFYHGHTYTANPLGCAAALASLDLFDETRLLDHVRGTGECLDELLGRFRSLPCVGDVRRIGMVAALELVQDRLTKEPFSGFDARIQRINPAGLERGIILRPLGSTVYLYPPLVSTREELLDMVTRLYDTLTAVFGK